MTSPQASPSAPEPTQDGAPAGPASRAGWPRPVLPTPAGYRMPAPWIARLSAEDEDNAQPGPAGDLAGVVMHPAEFDPARGQDVVDRWLCQVCGDPCQERAWAPVTPLDRDHPGTGTGPGAAAVYLISGGPVCSPRCVALTVARCPHFAAGAQVITFARSAVTWSDSGATEMAVLTWELAPQLPRPSLAAAR